MNPVAWFGLVLVLLLLGWDWLVKKRRLARRARLTDQDFLSAFRGPVASDADREILEVRRRIAQELALPTSSLRPEDTLTELRDHYCLVVSGHLALGDLLDDLAAARRGAAAAAPPAYPETVRDYIAAFVESSRARPSSAKP